MCRIDCETGDASDGALDDLAITGDQIDMLRLERMSDDTFWGAIHMKDGTGYTLKIWAEKRKLAFNIETL
jgi:hypothetical protein